MGDLLEISVAKTVRAKDALIQIAALTHAVENVGTTDAHVLIVEVQELQNQQKK